MLVRTIHALPPGDLVVVPDTRRKRLTAGLGRDVGRFSDEEGARKARPLSIVFDNKVRRDVGRSVAEASHRGEDDAVVERDVADGDRLEKSRGRHLEYDLS